MARSPVTPLRRGLLLSVLSLVLPTAVSADEVTDWHEHMLDVLGAAGPLEARVVGGLLARVERLSK